LPYALWCAVVGAVTLVAQPGFGYCLELHPRLCGQALVADARAPWDMSQGLLVVVLVATGFVVIAARRTLGRAAGFAFAAWAALAGSAVVFVGGDVAMCVGPLGVTPESCRVALGIPPETPWDRFTHSLALPIAILLLGWLAIACVARLRERQRGGL
jgi:hypothetical protein